MSLFNTLLNLHSHRPTEDFFTEIVAYFFRTNKELFIDWFNRELATNYSASDAEIYISTQITYEGLDNHNRDSRPDISIEITTKSEKDIIFIESKIGSTEGDNQLQNYADILSSIPDIKKRYLIYITKDYEPKNQESIIRDHAVIFHQTRWYKFFIFLNNKYKNISLSPEILNFMKGQGMTNHNKFTSLDLLALSGFKRVISIMDETLKGNIKDQFIKTLGSCSQDSSSLTQYKHHNRYIISKNGDFWCGLGYFKTSDPNEPFDFGVIIEVSPKYSRRPEIIKMMSEVCSQEPEIWKPHALGNSNAWSSISSKKNLQDILSDSDHILAIETFFLECLTRVGDLKNKYSSLDW